MMAQIVSRSRSSQRRIIRCLLSLPAFLDSLRTDCRAWSLARFYGGLFGGGVFCFFFEKRRAQRGSLRRNRQQRRIELDESCVHGGVSGVAGVAGSPLRDERAV